MFPIFSPTKILDSLILIQLVTEGPTHGYALTALIEEKFGWKPSQTAVYNALKAMESKNMVTVEEQIESGRVQKIYSLTEKGRTVFEERKKKFQEHIMKNLSQFFSFIQNLADIKKVEESEQYHKRIKSIYEDLGRISCIVLILLQKAPKETQNVIENTLSSLEEIAEKLDIKLASKEEFLGDNCMKKGTQKS